MLVRDVINCLSTITDLLYVHVLCVCACVRVCALDKYRNRHVCFNARVHLLLS